MPYNGGGLKRLSIGSNQLINNEIICQTGTNETAEVKIVRWYSNGCTHRMWIESDGGGNQMWIVPERNLVGSLSGVGNDDLKFNKYFGLTYAGIHPSITLGPNQRLVYWADTATDDGVTLECIFAKYKQESGTLDYLKTGNGQRWFEHTGTSLATGTLFSTGINEFAIVDLHTFISENSGGPAQLAELKFVSTSGDGQTVTVMNLVGGSFVEVRNDDYFQLYPAPDRFVMPPQCELQYRFQHDFTTRRIRVGVNTTTYAAPLLF